MTQTIRRMRGHEVAARDGRIGSVADVYFDDDKWAVRYVVVQTGGWLGDKRVLIPPAAVAAELSRGKKLRLALRREQVERAPAAETEPPVSRQKEAAVLRHYGFPYYWTGPLLWGGTAHPATLPPPEDAPQAEEGDPHLRSGAEVIGYDVEARDGAIGAVEDFVIDDKTWAIREVVVDTKKWWPGGQVAVHPAYVERIDWGARKVHVRLTREQVKLSGARTARS